MRQRLVRHANTMCVFGDFASVHNCAGNFYWPHEVEVVVTHIVGELLNLGSCEIRFVLDNVEMHWACCGNCSFIGN